MFFRILFILFLFSSTLFAQGVRETGKIRSFRSLGKYQKRWVLFHPFIAKKAYRVTQTVLAETAEIKKDTALDKDDNGGQVDAFRHAYWMALLGQKIKYRKAYKLGLAHEKDNKRDFEKGKPEENALPDSLSSVMDIENNAAGIKLGKANRKLNKDELKALVVREIKAGRMKVLMKDRAGNYLSCDGKIIDMNLWNGKWGIPKCLVNSDYLILTEVKKK